MKRAQLKYKYNSILLIDDNELDNFINEKMVEANYFSEKIFTNTNGKSALEFLNNLSIAGSNYPEIMFVDLNMPIMDGFKFIETFLRQNNDKKFTSKIVILTSSINPEDKRKAEEIGKDIVFVNKPLTNETLKSL